MFGFRITPITWCLVGLICAVSCQPTKESENDTSAKVSRILGWKVSQEQLDEFVESKIRELDIPGISLAIIDDGKVVYHKTAGFANLQDSLPVTDKTLFEGASISKPVFAYFVMTFVDEGLLDLDTPLYQYLPYPDIAYDERYKAITARMVLSHRAGFPNWREDEADNQLKLKFDPGAAYSYSGEGYQYLALVLKSLLGTDWAGLEKAFQRRVARPLGMTHTMFIQNDYSRRNKAEPYGEQLDWINWRENYWFRKNDTIFSAPASIHSEALDFSKWLIALMNEKGLSAESFEELLKEDLRVPDSDIGKEFNALGLPKVKIPVLGSFYGHNGNNEGFTSGFVFKKHKKWGYVYFTNSENGDAFGLALLQYLVI